MINPSIATVLAMIQKSVEGNLGVGNGNELAKAFTQSNNQLTGLTAFDLEGPAKTFTPIITPLRNMLPRVSGGMGIQANWRAITAIGSAGMSVGVSEGARGGLVTTTVKEYLAAYRTLGIEDSATFEADQASQGFDDVKARAVQGVLKHLMQYEETVIIGGAGTQALGVTPTPTLSTATTGGTIAATTTVSVICVALTLEGWAFTQQNGGIGGQITRTNADGTTTQYGSGSAQKSANATVVTGGTTTNTVSASVTPVRGAVGYAWYVGPAASERYAGVTTINSILVTALPSGTALMIGGGSTDYSTNATIHDGFLGLATPVASGAYWATQPTGTAGTGTPLTADGAGGIVEIDTMLESYWTNYRMSPTEIWVNQQEMAGLRKKVLTGTSTAAQRFTFQTAQGNIVASGLVRGYLNPFGMGMAMEVPIKLHPSVPPGTILALAHELPYQLSGVQNVNQIKCRRDYYQLEWPLRTRKYEYGVYTDQVLQCYFPPSIGVITNIARG